MPRTEAGKRLLEREALNERAFPLITAADIDAIEAEARNTLDEERLARAKDDALCRVWDRIAALRVTGPWLARKRQVLDIITEERAAIAKAYREDAG